ncbi:MAG: hypothetical protein CVU86_04060 [Firmicutes bacterium HGW-Firmicutes-11]|jgi:hypothetical protein|nr:MAG: hypothetical protein CVU86_04060 [Firmicutes bacterium HGW-Firmicutes-11]
MSKVDRTKENLEKCICMTCPSYAFACKKRSLTSNVILTMVGTDYRIHAEAMFCAYEESHCIDEEKGCICADCEVHKEYQLEKGYFCVAAGGK